MKNSIFRRQKKLINKRAVKAMNQIKINKKKTQQSIQIFTIKTMAFQMQEKEKLRMRLTPKNHQSLAQLTFPYGSSVKHRKKRIGPYSYYQQDLIGYGSSSQVYRCVYRDDKSRIYAIKVIQLRKMTNSLYKLLQNEIQILRKLQHPHILKLHDVYFTENNCYLVTDFCEGGTLQNYLDHCRSSAEKKEGDFKPIFEQLIHGCKYLAQQLVIHRDIKPANIFLKGGVWKIGDFGFARTLSNPTEVIHEKYNVGSPLFMPLEALQKSIYSLKTDSFALGVVLFLILVRQFPWSGKNKRELIASYNNKQFPKEKLNHVNQSFQTFIQSLCRVEISSRIYITEYDKIIKQNGIQKNLMESEQTEESHGLESEDQIGDAVRQLGLKLGDQLKLCLFIVYLDRNILGLVELSQLGVIFRRHLRFLVKVFSWNEKTAMQNYIKEFQCDQFQPLEQKLQYTAICSILKKHITILSTLKTDKHRVLRLKLRQYERMIEALIGRDSASFKKQLALLTLHPNFNQVCIRQDELKKIQKSTIVNYSF